jgi:hypothetical protein
MKKLIFSAIFSGIIGGILLIASFFFFTEMIAKKTCVVEKKDDFCIYLAISEAIEGNYDNFYHYIELGCLSGNEELCNRTGVIVNSGLNGYLNLEMAYGIFDWGCDLGDQKSCSDKKLLVGETTQDSEKPSPEETTLLEIKTLLMNRDKEKTEKLIIEKTKKTPYLVIMILKDPVLKKTAENKRLHEHYLSLLSALKRENEKYIMSAGGKR